MCPSLLCAGMITDALKNTLRARMVMMFRRILAALASCFPAPRLIAIVAPSGEQQACARRLQNCITMACSTGMICDTSWLWPAREARSLRRKSCASISRQSTTHIGAREGSRMQTGRAPSYRLSTDRPWQGVASSRRAHGRKRCGPRSAHRFFREGNDRMHPGDLFDSSRPPPDEVRHPGPLQRALSGTESRADHDRASGRSVKGRG